jgi:hypothetical protein
MSEIVEGLGTAERERIAVLRKAERFFWVDVSLGETSRDDLGEALGISSHALEPHSGCARSRSTCWSAATTC